MKLESFAFHAPQSKEAAKSLIQEHCKIARVILFASKISNILLPETIEQGAWLRNHLPSSINNGNTQRDTIPRI